MEHKSTFRPYLQKLMQFFQWHSLCFRCYSFGNSKTCYYNCHQNWRFGSRYRLGDFSRRGWEPLLLFIWVCHPLSRYDLGWRCILLSQRPCLSQKIGNSLQLTMRLLGRGCRTLEWRRPSQKTLHQCDPLCRREERNPLLRKGNWRLLS